MGFFTGQMGIPALFAALAILAESAGAVALIAGFLGRITALGIGSVMIGAAVMVHAKVGFFMNWTGQLPGEGYEYHLLALGLALVVMLQGAGRYSVDRVLTQRIDAKH